MNKITRKCPNCGAVMQANAKYCRKCHAKLDSGRVETLQNTETDMAEKPARKMPWQKRGNDDALRNLPRPVRPAEDVQTDEAAQQGEGFFAPAYAGENNGKIRPNRMNMNADGSPRPVSTARGVGDGQETGGTRDKNLWQIIAVLAALLVVIVIAIVLVVRLNQPAEEAVVPSEPFNSPSIVNVNAGAAGEGDNAAPPVQSAVPTVTAPPKTTATPKPTNTPAPRPSATPAVSPTPGTTTVDGVTVTATSDTIYISGSTVNIRSGPTTASQILGTESRGYQLQRTGTTGSTSNDWSRVNYNGNVAYVSNSLISTSQVSASGGSSSGSGTTGGSTGGYTGGSTGGSTNQTITAASGTVTVSAASGANLRSAPSMSATIVTAVANNTQLTRTGTAAGGWTQVSYNGQTLYVATSLLGGGSSSSGSSSSSSGVTAASGTGTVKAVGGLFVRSGPGTGYSKIGSVANGSSVTITGTSGSWYQISYNGQTGYVSSQYVTKN